MSQENKTLVLRANEEILNKGNLDFIDEAFAADYVNNGSRHDRAGIKQSRAGLRSAFPDLHVTIEPLLAEGEMVAFLRTSHGTNTGEHRGSPATNKTMTWRTMIISRVVEGKIVEEWSISNLTDQFGR